MEYKITSQFPNEFILNPQGTVLSIYQETHLSSPDNEQDPIRFKNLLKEAKKSETSELKLPQEAWDCLERLAKDAQFWTYNAHGLAVFVSAEACQIYRLKAAVPNSHYLGESFYLLPLLHYFDALDHAYVLSFDRGSFQLLEGNQYGLNPSIIPEKYATKFRDLFPDLDKDSNLNAGSYGGRQATFHGHRARPEELEKDQGKFFLHIDHVLSDMLSPHDPIILVALPEHQAEFRKIVKNNNVLEKGVEKPYSALKEKELLAAIGEILEAARKEQLEQFMQRIEQAEREEKLVQGQDAIARLIKEGRVDSLLISVALMDDLTAEGIKQLNELTFASLDQGGHFYVLPAEYFAHGAKYQALLRY